ncbi:MAG: insulinase family protein, partial [Pontixanthobacter sp.]
AGPVDPDFRGQTDIYLDPALTETITVSRNRSYLDRPDTFANSVDDLLYSIAARALSRRLQRIQRSEDPPFRGVSISSGGFFEAADTTQIAVSSEAGEWKHGLDSAIDEVRRALQFGFSDAEVAEQIANMRTAFENSAANAATRSNGDYVGDAFEIARGDGIPASPDAGLAFFENTLPKITPRAVLEAYRARIGKLDDPLIRFTGKTAPVGGAEALRAAVSAAFAREVSPPEDNGTTQFAYTDFGPVGTIISDMRTDKLDIRTLQFANGVRLNLKPTDLEDDRISIQVSIDGGLMLATHDDPLAVELDGLLISGGLGKHSLDDLQSILAGRSVAGSFDTGLETFVSAVTTTPRDFDLQLQLFTAYVVDPGYRTEGLGPWRKSLDDFFARLGKTPGSAFGEASRAILSDNDPRFTRQPLEDYRELDFERLKSVISDRLAHGAIEIGIVGDFDEDEAIQNVARTFGALPMRESDFSPFDNGERIRDFTQDLGPFIITHGGEPDQAMIQLVWPTTDDEDTQRTSRLNLLERIVRLQLTEKLREELGQVYSPSVDSSQSGTYIGYGTFSIGASVDVSKIDAAKAAMTAVIEELRRTPPDADLIQRARQPVLEMFDNRLKSNAGWMSLVSRAQSEPEYIDIFTGAQQRYLGITGAELQVLAIEYLDPAKA